MNKIRLSTRVGNFSAQGSPKVANQRGKKSVIHPEVTREILEQCQK